ncbi:MAG: tRNA (adenosine(37)-N6)-dimethylallyltransferase MiaA [Lachnospiraceae bacterium]|nr:tRNA (adenosine(37)-N6)-dimethylallyltransferase MiaA [Lachnospiraceae bacterium]
MKQKMIILTGPTAVGKTELSIALAHRLGGSIISADSMQIYKYMDIGTAKIKPEEMGGIPHYLVDELLPSEEFHVVRFQQMAKQALEEIYAQNRIPIVVGGTGFYIQALLYDIDFAGTGEESSIRKNLERIAKEEGAEVLHARLQEVDPESAKIIHPNNVKRTIRALEFYEETKTPISAHNEEQRQKESPYDFRYFVLTHDRGILYERIEQRVDQMLQEGLVEEVRHLKDMGYTRDMVSMQGLGYKEILSYLDEEISLDQAVSILKRDTRHFAKRQLTWFRRERDVIWLDKREYPTTDVLLSKIEENLW